MCVFRAAVCLLTDTRTQSAAGETFHLRTTSSPSPGHVTLCDAVFKNDHDNN